jgi:hypothetical protein
MSGMLHSIKVMAAKHATSTAGDAEFDQYKGLLKRVKANMLSGTHCFEETNSLWLKQITAQRTFASSFQASYVPFGESDETLTLVKEFADSSKERHARLLRETSTEKTSYHHMQTQIMKYIQEIEAVEALYPSLHAAKSEMDRYQSKGRLLSTRCLLYRL